MKNLKFPTAFLLLVSLFFTACDKDDEASVDEQELITTVQMVFIEYPDSTTTSFTVKDMDGEGGNPPQAEQITLKANTTYVFNTIFKDESNISNPVDFSEEIVEEGTSHLVCFETTGAMVALVGGDNDSDGEPIGLIGALTTEEAGSGTLKVKLKHAPDKSATDPCSTGETDVEVSFDVKIE